MGSASLLRLVRDLVQVGRFYTTPLLMLGGVTAMFYGPDLRLAPLVIALLLTTLLAFGVAAANDYAHYGRDQRAGRGRTTPPRYLLLLSLTSLAGMLVVAQYAGVLLGMLVVLGVGIGYGFAKSLLGLSVFLRGSTSSALILTLGTLNGVALPKMLPLAIGLGVLDAAGNIWGDIRDRQADEQAGLHTLAVVALPVARVFAFLLHGVALALLMAHTVLVWASLLPHAGLWFLPARRTHRMFLMIKYATVLVLAVPLVRTPLEGGVIAVLGGVGAVAAWQIYGRVHSLRTII